MYYLIDTKGSEWSYYAPKLSYLADYLEAVADDPEIRGAVERFCAALRTGAPLEEYEAYLGVQVKSAEDVDPDERDLIEANVAIARAQAELDAARRVAADAAQRARRQGMSEYRISSLLGVTRTTVRRWLSH